MNNIEELSSVEIALLLNLKPQQVDEALTLIPTLQRFQENNQEEVI